MGICMGVARIMFYVILLTIQRESFQLGETLSTTVLYNVEFSRNDAAKCRTKNRAKFQQSKAIC